MEFCKTILLENITYKLCNGNVERIDNDFYNILLEYKKENKKIKINSVSKNILIYPRILTYTAVKVPRTDYYALKPGKHENLHTYYKPQMSKYRGAYGSVDIFQTEEVAIKNFNKDIIPPSDFILELTIYKFLEHNCIANLYSYNLEKCNIEIELADEVTTLDTLLKRDYKIRPKNPEEKTSEEIGFFYKNDNNIIWGIGSLIQCIQQINNFGIIHSDIKHANLIAVNNEGNIGIKFIDWGLANIDHSKEQKYVKNILKYTVGYRPPECNLIHFEKRNTYNYKSDIFAIGITLLYSYYAADLFQNYLELVDLGHKDFNVLYMCFLYDFFCTNSFDYLQKINKRLDIKDSINNVLIQVENIDGNHKIIYNKLISGGTVFNLPKIPETCAELLCHMLDFNPETRWDHQQILNYMYEKGWISEDVKDKPLKQWKYNNIYKNIDINHIWKEKNIDRKQAFEKIISSLTYDDINNVSAICLAFELLDEYIINSGDVKNIDEIIDEIIKILVFISNAIHQNKDGLGINILKRNYNIKKLKKTFNYIIDFFKGDFLRFTFYSYLLNTDYNFEKFLSGEKSYNINMIDCLDNYYKYK